MATITAQNPTIGEATRFMTDDQVREYTIGRMKFEFQERMVHAKIRREGRAEGFAKGRTEGLEEGVGIGVAKGRLALITKMLRRRFGDFDAAPLDRLLDKSPEELDSAFDDACDCASLEEFLAAH